MNEEKFSDEDYYDTDPDYDYEFYSRLPPESEEVFEYTLSYCLIPSLTQTLPYVFMFVIINYLFRYCLEKLYKQPEFVKHMLSSVFGACILVYQYNDPRFYFYYIQLILTSYGLMRFLMWKHLCKGKLGLTISFFCIFNLLYSICEHFSEYYASNPRLWAQTRGTQMLTVMKLISIAYDIDLHEIKSSGINFLSCVGYVICPANNILGPWIGFQNYRQVLYKEKWTNPYYLQITCNILIAFTFLLSSNCVIPHFVSDETWKWLPAYRDALSFRTSHYFITFLSQAVMTAAGFTDYRFIPKQNKDTLSYKLFGSLFVNPYNIEIPRSLVTVVTSWNFPMHYWLKTYIFRQLLPFGNFIAITSTYFMSALLHGLNLRLSAVLLTLGIATYFEYVIRLKLGAKLRSCMLAKKCKLSNKKKCLNKHDHSDYSYRSLVGNVLFSVLAVIHLTYLGVIMNSQSDSIDNGSSSFGFIMERWGNLNFLTHFLIMFKLILSKIL